jgi:hypothetical protein
MVVVPLCIKTNKSGKITEFVITLFLAKNEGLKNLRKISALTLQNIENKNKKIVGISNYLN